MNFSVKGQTRLTSSGQNSLSCFIFHSRPNSSASLPTSFPPSQSHFMIHRLPKKAFGQLFFCPTPQRFGPWSFSFEPGMGFQKWVLMQWRAYQFQSVQISSVSVSLDQFSSVQIRELSRGSRPQNEVNRVECSHVLRFWNQFRGSNNRIYFVW